jgi:2-oxoglutarate ferredoxin oxidoreductase subunit beta
MLKAALSHRGTVMLDIISPCVTFNDHEGSTKSYKYVKDHEEPLHDINFVPHFENIDVEYDPGTTIDVTMHDGSHLRLRKLNEDYDPTNRVRALSTLTESHERGEVLTGVFYIDTRKPNFIDLLNLTDHPLATLPESQVRPGREALNEVMEELR